MAFSAQDVKKLRDATGVGMMDAKKALEATDGDMEAASKWLLEKGLAKSAERTDRENSEGAVSLGRAGRAAALVELKSETDFVAKSPDFVAFAHAGADAVAKDGEGALDSLKERLDLFRSYGRIVRDENELFNVQSWLFLFDGQDVRPEGYDPRADTLSSERARRALDNIRAVVAKCAADMPLHEAFIAQHCAAASADPPA